jgi:hypothetical protein
MTNEKKLENEMNHAHRLLKFWLAKQARETPYQSPKKTLDKIEEYERRYLVAQNRLYDLSNEEF